jgi:protein-tyrosine sulfotransferase
MFTKQIYRQKPEFWYYILDMLLPVKRALPFLGYPVNTGQVYHPFFIIGSGRSGNTLLRRILYAHPALHIPPETFVLGTTIRLFRQYRTMNWPDLVHLILAQFEFYPEFETFEISLRPLALRLIEAPENCRSLAFVLDSFYRYHAEMKGIQCQRWGDKTPLNTFVLERILSVFPDAQFIHIVRDGVDVVSSYMEADIGLDLDNAANRWLTSVRAVKQFAKRHPLACQEIRYEKLVKDPQESIFMLCNFLSIEFYPDIIESHELAKEMGDVVMRRHHFNVGKPIAINSIGKGRNILSMTQKQHLQKLIGDELTRLGYESAIS